MSRIGADPVALRQLGVAAKRLADQAEHSAFLLDREVRHCSWRGPDARNFARDWRQIHQPALRHIAAECKRFSSQLKQQAQQQEQASDGSFDSGRAVNDQAPQNQALQNQALRKPNAFATSELRVLSGAQITAGALVVGSTHNLTIQQFPHGVVKVTSTERNQAGLAATAGASLTLGTHSAALGANLRAQVSVGQLTRREYVTTHSNLPAEIALIEAEAAVRRSAVASSALPGFGIAAGLLTHFAPEIARTEQLTELSLTAQGTASLASSLGVQGSVRGGGSFRFGQGHHAQILELEGTTASLISGQLLQRLRLASVGDGGTEVYLSRLRIEIPDKPLHGADLIVSSTTTDGHREFRTVSNVNLSEPGSIRGVEQVQRAIEQLKDTELDQAMRSLAEIDLPISESLTRSGEFVVSEHTGILGATVGAGIGLGISGDGGYQQLRLVS